MSVCEKTCCIYLLLIIQCMGVAMLGLQYMDLAEGSIIQVLITIGQNPSEFCVQPYSPLLIELKEQIW